VETTSADNQAETKEIKYIKKHIKLTIKRKKQALVKIKKCEKIQT